MSDLQDAAIEKMREIIDKAGKPYGFEMISTKMVPPAFLEIGIKPRDKSNLKKWNFVRIDIRDKTIGEIARKAAAMHVTFAKSQLMPN